MTKVQRGPTDLEREFEEQLELLQTSVEAFDKGKFPEAKRIATSLRIFVHDTGASTSLLKQLNKKNGLFLDTAMPLKESEGVIIPQSTLTYRALGGNEDSLRHQPLLDTSFSQPREADFDAWWNGVVFVDQFQKKFSRADLVLKLANEDGGAHVDPGISADYHRLTRENSLGHMVTDKSGQWTIVDGPAQAAVRQIAHEFLKTFDVSYETKRKASQGILLGNISINVSEKRNDTNRKKLGRNELCSCGSGKKYKKCCIKK